MGVCFSGFCLLRCCLSTFSLAIRAGSETLIEIRKADRLSWVQVWEWVLTFHLASSVVISIGSTQCLLSIPVLGLYSVVWRADCFMIIALVLGSEVLGFSYRKLYFSSSWSGPSSSSAKVYIYDVNSLEAYFDSERKFSPDDMSFSVHCSGSLSHTLPISILNKSPTACSRIWVVCWSSPSHAMSSSLYPLQYLILLRWSYGVCLEMCHLA